MKTIFAAIILLGVATNTFSKDHFANYVAMKFAGQIVTSYEFSQYIEDHIISDGQMKHWFKQAQGRYPEYLTLKRNWTKKNYKKHFRQYALIRLVQIHALQDKQLFGLGRDQNLRRFFDLSAQQLQQHYRQHFQLLLKSYRKKEDEDTSTKLTIARELVDKGHPYQNENNLSSIYDHWRRRQEISILENLRKNYFHEYLNFKALKNGFSLHIRPIEIRDFYERNRAELKKVLVKKDYSYYDLKQLLKANPSFATISEQVNVIHLKSTPLAKISEQSPAHFQDLLQLIKKDFLPTLNSHFQKQFEDYNSYVDEFANKYSIAQLQQLIKKHETNRAKEKLLGFLYKIALSIKQTQKRQLSKWISSIQEINKNIKRILSNPSEIMAKNYRQKNLRTIFSEIIIDSAVPTEWQEVVSYIYHHHLLTITIQDKGLATVSVSPFNAKSSDKIQRYLEKLKRKQLIEQFIVQDILQNSMNSLVLTLDGVNDLKSQEAIDFLFPKAKEYK